MTLPVDLYQPWAAFLAPYQQQWANITQTLAQISMPEILECEKILVYTQDKVKLYRYSSLSSTKQKIPLLVVFALVNRPYILDLQPDRSLIRPLLEAGFDVYIVDWGYPTLEDRNLRLEDYVLTYFNNCVDYIRTSTKKRAIDLLGVCQAGTLSLCYTALFPQKIRKLITMITAVDFHTPDNTLSELVQEIDMVTAAQVYGNMPGWLLNLVFFSLKPNASHWLKYKRAFKEDPKSEKMANFLRMERWIYDTPDLAAATFSQYITELYQKNALIHKKFYLDNKLVDLAQIKQPVLNIFALRDDIIPPSASRDLKKYIGSKDYSELTFDGGHIGIYASQRSQKQIAPKIVEWLAKGKIL